MPKKRATGKRSAVVKRAAAVASATPAPPVVAAPVLPDPPASVVTPRLSPLAVAAGAFLATLTLFELLVIPFPWLGRAAAWLWLASFVPVAAFVGREMASFTADAFRSRRFLPWALAVAPAVGIVVYCALANRVNMETAQQLRCALEGLLDGEDGAYRSTCFVGYPARGYFLMTLPSLVLGRTLFALKLGAALHFVLGFPLFVAEIARLFRESTEEVSKVAGVATVGVLALFLHFRFPLLSTMLLEQAAFPFALALLVTGLCLSFRRTGRPETLLVLALTQLHCSFTYTPGFALAVGLFALGLLVAWQRRSEPRELRVLAGSLAAAFVMLVAACFVRSDLSFTGVSAPSASRAQELVMAMVDTTRDLPWASLLGVGAVAAATLATLAGTLGSVGVLVGLWIVGVLGASQLLPGYANPPPHVALHRASVALPPLLALVALLLGNLQRAASPFAQWTRSRTALGVAAALFVSTGLVFLWSTREAPGPERFYRDVVRALAKDVPANGELSLWLGPSPEERGWLGPIYETVVYLWPNAKLRILDEQCRAAPGASGVVLTLSNSSCGARFRADRAPAFDVFDRNDERVPRIEAYRLGK